MKFRFLSILLLILIGTLSLTSCVDELLNPEEFGDGESIISTQVCFISYDKASLGGTRTAGNAIDTISKLDIFIFKANGEFVGKYNIPRWTAHKDNHGRPDNGTTTNDPTLRCTFDFPVPVHYGRYKMYAVANVSDSHLEGIETIPDLLDISLAWNPDNVASNSQMLGFLETSNVAAGADYNSFTAPTITIKTPQTTLFAWVRRAASKLTIAYDGRDLLDNVYIYLKSVTVHNIARTAYLGKDSKADSSSDLYEDGETEYYYDRTAYPQGLSQSVFGPDWKTTITKGNYLQGSDHSDNSNSLFFFENMQGKGESKLQDADGDGKIDSPDSNNPDDPDWRDRMPNGTYIEVDAWYVSNIPGHMGNGPIKYRFMLGQNIVDDYNVMRNCHYKVTLHFNKYANDVDWHIDYDKPEPSIDAPNPYYISYLYDKEMCMPVQINGELHPDSLVTATILTNDWYPFNAPKDMYYWQEAEKNTPWNGFLSLRNTLGRVNVEGTLKYDANKEFYDSNNRGWRTFETTASPTPYGDDKDGYYTVQKNEDGRMGVTIMMPLYTRAKNLISSTGYTGNNPYTAYQRKATVQIKAILFNPVSNSYQPFLDTVTIYQVRRIVNPKGVWRDWNEDSKFYIQLTHLLSTPGTDISTSDINFETFQSQGPWSAEIVGSNSDWVELSAGKNSYKQGNKIYGHTGSEVEFYYKPKDKLSDPNAVRCAIIKIRYHNFTCEHTVFVRQGYAPLAVIPGQKKWYSYNMRSQTERAQSPLEEGSMFKWRGWNNPINCTNNKRGGVYGFNQQLWASPLWIYPDNSGTEGKSWVNIGGTAGGAWDNATMDGNSVELATMEDYMALKNHSDVNYGYGVLYDGSSDGVQMSVKDAYGYYYDQPTGQNGKGRGMRGVFVYDDNTGNQIFFPIGASGYGRRKGRPTDGESFSRGVLRYANRCKLYSDANINMRPLFYRLYLSPGAIYWIKEKGVGDEGDGYAWDMNYDTYNFNEFTTNAYPGGDVASQSDACFVRCVAPAGSAVRKRNTVKRNKTSTLQRRFRK